MFRPCIDLHNGKVKQIIGGTLNDQSDAPSTNFISAHPSFWFAELYKKDGLTGGHSCIKSLPTRHANWWWH
jgi:phosphoribosylformimino-5-aminoimidazole carboxamide ribotide isomerase